jgi:hypothetical protein
MLPQIHLATLPERDTFCLSGPGMIFVYWLGHTCCIASTWHLVLAGQYNPKALLVERRKLKSPVSEATHRLPPDREWLKTGRSDDESGCPCLPYSSSDPLAAIPADGALQQCMGVFDLELFLDASAIGFNCTRAQV